MRRVLSALAAVSVAASILPAAAVAQTQPGSRNPAGGQQAEEPRQSRAPRIAPLRQRVNAGPCP